MTTPRQRRRRFHGLGAALALGLPLVACPAAAAADGLQVQALSPTTVFAGQTVAVMATFHLDGTAAHPQFTSEPEPPPGVTTWLVGDEDRSGTERYGDVTLGSPTGEGSITASFARDTLDFRPVDLQLNLTLRFDVPGSYTVDASLHTWGAGVLWYQYNHASRDCTGDAVAGWACTAWVFDTGLLEFRHNFDTGGSSANGPIAVTVLVPEPADLALWLGGALLLTVAGPAARRRRAPYRA